MPPVEREIRLVYRPLEKSLRIAENDFSTFEALGLFEAAKAMIVEAWLAQTDGAD